MCIDSERISVKKIARLTPTQERARQARICVSLWACAYEMLSHSFVSDAKFDETCKQVARDLHIDTDRPDLDAWFRKEFSADTGQWIWRHPDLELIKLRCDYLLNWPKNEKSLMCFFVASEKMRKENLNCELVSKITIEFLQEQISC